VVGEHGDVRPAGQRRPVRAGERDLLVIVEHGHARQWHWGSSGGERAGSAHHARPRGRVRSGPPPPARRSLLFGNPLPSLEAVHDEVIDDCAARFSGTFFTLFLDLWHHHPFPIPADDEIDPGLRQQLARYRVGLGADIPLGAGLVFLRCWVHLYGTVSLEVFGHLGFALTDASAMFDLTLGELAALAGLE
jgi:hypothetical protein